MSATRIDDSRFKILGFQQTEKLFIDLTHAEEDDDHDFEKPKRKRKSAVRKKKPELDESGNFECEHCKLIFWYEIEK